MRDSPRVRRLRSDLRVLEALRADSTILDYQAHGDPPEAYVVLFRGRGLAPPDESGEPQIRELHEVSIRLGASYPCVKPELEWQTPIFHPNISFAGLVCLGGIGKHWVPSLNLDELCEMLWDMIRYKNFDIGSPYNWDAAKWAQRQPKSRFPLDPRPIRDKVAHVAPPVRPKALPKAKPIVMAEVVVERRQARAVLEPDASEDAGIRWLTE
jgi:hypothetical protein